MEEKILRDCGRYGQPIPDAIKDAPDLRMGLTLFYAGFWDLHSCRPVGLDVGPIPLTAILDYCTAYQIDGDQREDFIWLIRRLDAEYRKWMRNHARPNKVQQANTGAGR